MIPRIDLDRIKAKMSLVGQTLTHFFHLIRSIYIWLTRLSFCVSCRKTGSLRGRSLRDLLRGCLMLKRSGTHKVSTGEKTWHKCLRTVTDCDITERCGSEMSLVTQSLSSWLIMSREHRDKSWCLVYFFGRSLEFPNQTLVKCLRVCLWVGLTDDDLTVRSLGGEVSHDGDFMIFEANRYSRKGFLFKSFAMSAVVRRRFHFRIHTNNESS